MSLLQRVLRSAGLDPAPVDGAFGSRRGAKDFQEAAGTTVDGFLGPQTWRLRL